MTEWVDDDKCEGPEDVDRAMQEAIDLIDYLADAHADMRAAELDLQFEAEGD